MEYSNFKAELSDEGYDEKIKVSTSKNYILYDGLCDEFVTSINDRLELKLNFGNKEVLFHYELKRVDDYIVLIPRIILKDNFLELLSKGTLVFSYKDIIQLWNLLRYDISELDSIPIVDNKDWALLWLLNIDIGLKTLQLNELTDWVVQQTFAEYPEGNPKITDIVKLIISNNINFCNESFDNLVTSKFVTAYLENIDKRIIEWNAIDFLNRHRILLGNNWSIEYTNNLSY